MLKITVISVGQISEPYWKDAINEYKKRLGRTAAVSEVCLDEARLPQDPSDAEIKRALDSEADAILGAIPERSFVVPLCIEGTLLSSEELAAKIDRAMSDGFSRICFVIGSSFGLSDRVKARADLKFSMSRLTFPHQMAKVVLFEAVYRAMSILSGSKYHK